MIKRSRAGMLHRAADPLCNHGNPAELLEVGPRIIRGVRRRDAGVLRFAADWRTLRWRLRYQDAAGLGVTLYAAKESVASGASAALVGPAAVGQTPSPLARRTGRESPPDEASRPLHQYGFSAVLGKATS